MLDYRLYLVTDDPSRYSGDWIDHVRAAVEGGVTCVQYRDTENAPQVQYERILRLRDALKTFKTPIVVNNDAELAAAVKAEGVHVGQGDCPPARVREIVGPNCEIGRSITCLEDLKNDLPLVRVGLIDCLGVGPVFDARKTKADAAEAMGTEGLREIVSFLRGESSLRPIPVVAIGGISIQNASAVLSAGANGLAVVSAFSKSTDPASAAREFERLFASVPIQALATPNPQTLEPSRTQSFNPCCLTIAGSDSGGNAGVQADLRAFHAYGLHGCTVFAALTAQNPFGVAAIHNVPADFVAAQLDAVLGIYDIRALKTGMLSDAAVIEVVADRLATHPEIAKVIDPVMVATSGARLVSDSAMEVIKRRLLPIATLITPNLPEAEALCGRAIEPNAQRAGDAAHAGELARRLADRFGCAVLVKGGHGSGASAVDVLAANGKDPTKDFAMPWVANPVSTHGTGCTLAAALAAEFALGADVESAVAGAKRHVHEAIANSYSVGLNCGVLGFVSPPRARCRREGDGDDPSPKAGSRVPATAT